MGTHTQLAEEAVIEAIETLVARGDRPYSHNVPLEAQRILVAKGHGRVTLAEASDSVRNAIVSLDESGAIEAHAEPRKTWKITDST